MMRLALLALALTLLAPARADALVCGLFGCSCTVTAAPLDFGDIAPLDGAQDGEGAIEIDCTGIAELTPSMVVRMQSGDHGTIAARKMQSDSGGYLLDYNIYTSSLRNTVWGDGTTGATVTVNGALVVIGDWNITRAVHARVSPTPATRPGDYSDHVIVRIDW
jgi:spore coat protein U-like protein